MKDNSLGRIDELLDALTNEVARRLEERWETHPRQVAERPASPAVPLSPPPETAATVSVLPIAQPEPAADPEPMPTIAPGYSSQAAAFLARLAIAVLIIVAVINIPLNSEGKALARLIPPSASLVIRNGLVVKESASPDIWVYRDGAFHLITSLDAFAHFGYTWQDVHLVEPGYLAPFERGTPLYVLLKCDASPHIYRLEGGGKRWIVDLATFQSEGYVWKDVEIVPCRKLQILPDGDSIPPGRGPPPPPLP